MLVSVSINGVISVYFLSLNESQRYAFGEVVIGHDHVNEPRPGHQVSDSVNFRDRPG